MMLIAWWSFVTAAAHVLWVFVDAMFLLCAVWVLCRCCCCGCCRMSYVSLIAAWCRCLPCWMILEVKSVVTVKCDREDEGDDDEQFWLDTLGCPQTLASHSEVGLAARSLEDST